MITLAGQWYYQTNAAAFDSSLTFDEGLFSVPGSTIENKIGTPYVESPGLTEETVKHLAKAYSFIGKLWLKKTLTIADYAPTSFYRLHIERAMWQTQLWVNGIYIGSCDALSTAHCFDITAAVSETVELVLCIDNTDIHDINTTPSAYTEETQSIWNGVIGQCMIEAVPEVQPVFHLEVNQETPSVTVSCQLMKASQQHELEFFIRVNDQQQEIHQAVQVLGAEGTQQLSFQFADYQRWDEFTPALYTVTYGIRKGNQELCVYTKDIGFRQWDATTPQLRINGQKTFLRGTIDCCIFPLTGYPPMEEAEWLRIFTRITSYGLNHVRFHSWCPPEAAFAVADRLGLYLQVEAPIWLDDWMPFMLGDKPDHYTFFLEESLRIVRAYGHHPSFCFFSCGNEIRGDYEILRHMVQTLKKENSSILYTLTSNWDRIQDEEDELFIAQTVDKLPVRGQYDLNKLTGSTALHFSEAIQQRSIPVISHEVGQYSIYPSMKEITKYTGNLIPKNFMAIRDDLQQKGMLSLAPAFTHASGRLAFELYKDEIEAALRTEGMGGYQLLGLNDFTGQSTATVGLLDAFWDEKGLTSSTEFTMFANAIVPLAVMEQRIYSVEEVLAAKILVANFRKALTAVTVHWQVANGHQILAEGQTAQLQLAMGVVEIPASIAVDLQSLVTANQQLTLTICVKASGQAVAENQWTIWVYVPAITAKDETPIITAQKPTKQLLEEIANGQQVLLLPQYEDVKGAEETTFFPVFWSPVHFKSKANCGLLIDDQHPVFQTFPTEAYGTYQWKPLVETGFSIPFAAFSSSFQPIVQAIPNFFNNKQLFVLAEATIGNGKVLISSLCLDEDSLVGSSFKQALIQYMQSDAFQPAYEMTPEELQQMFTRETQKEPQIDWAKKGCCRADSQQSTDFSPQNAIDDTASTSWKPIDNQPGHWWEIELPQPIVLKEIHLTLLSQGTYYYNISVSLDGQQYKQIVNKTADTSRKQQIVDELNTKVKFLRITYGDASSGAEIGHHKVSLFEAKE